MPIKRDILGWKVMKVREPGPIFGSFLLKCESTTLVSCIDNSGRPNIITCSAIYPVQPGYVGVAVGFTRYSHNLIRDSGEFVVNIPSRELREAMLFFGSRSGRDVDKFKECNLTPKPSRNLRTPIIGEFVAWIECKNFSQAVTHDHTIFIGKVLSAYAREDSIDILFNSEKNLHKYGVLNNYSSVNSIKRVCERTGADEEFVLEFWRRYYKIWGEHWLKR